MKLIVLVVPLLASALLLSSCNRVLVRECSAYIGIGALAGTAVAVLGTNEILGDSVSTGGKVAVGAGGAVLGGTLGYALCARAYRQRQILEDLLDKVEEDLPIEPDGPGPPPIVPDGPEVLEDQIVHLRLNIRFHSGSNRIETRSRAFLDALATSLSEGSPSDVLFIGYTDDRGSAAENLALSERRAMALANYIALQGVSAGRIRAEGKGEAEPIDTNATAEGRRNNRRVEVFIIQRS